MRTRGTPETKDNLQLHRVALFRPRLLGRTANYTCCAPEKGPGRYKWPLKPNIVLGLFLAHWRSGGFKGWYPVQYLRAPVQRIYNYIL